MWGFYLGLAIGIPFGMLIATLPWRDPRAVIDITPALPVASAIPAAFRRRHK